MIRPVAKLPDRWIEEGRQAGAHIDLRLKSPWQLFAAWEGNDPQGFIGLLLTSSSQATIRGWYVFPEHRGFRIGAALLLTAVGWAFDSGREAVAIRTAHQVEWAGFTWWGNETKTGVRMHTIDHASWAPCAGRS